MHCTICEIKNKNLRNEVERLLETNYGMIGQAEKNDLITKYPEAEENIKEITAKDCEIHWNFHQTVSREANDIAVVETEEQKDKRSLAGDINKDEADALYELLNKQSATFNILSRKLNEALQKTEVDESGISRMVINTNTMIMYKDMADSIRSTVKEISNLNASINGSKSGALEGLRSLAQAITGDSNKTSPLQVLPEPLDTKEYD